EENMGRGFIAITEPVLKRYRNESILLDGCRHKFAVECEGIGVRYTIHPNESVWDTDLFVKESRFSDLVLISANTFQTANQQAESSYFMEQVLRFSECPVIVVPEGFREIDRLAIAYDAGAESMFALKQFVYLFPYFTDHPSDIIHVKNDGIDDIPNRNLLLEYTKAHFDSTFASKLQFDAKKYFTTWVENKKNVILITGAYSRSSFSNTMRRSFAYPTIADHICPVFVAHSA
ncbi:MAG TPA: hypothetical protein VK622_01675, partial [Puia sp.]|nr:hypothetical protein [Puia sp.]